MKAIGYQHSLPIEDEKALQEIELEIPKAQGHDLLVEIKAISANPVDYKIRQRLSPEKGQWKVLGWDAAGIVKEAGEDVALFKPGDHVWYAGDLTRSGSNAELQLVDERIVGRMPQTLSFAEAAALPLTTITAWEMLFDRLEVDRSASHKSILVIGAAGGVGSIMVQLVKKLTRLQVIATASRPETTSWLKDLGADHILNHRNPLSEEFSKKNLPKIDYVASLNQTGSHFPEIIKIIKPQGKFGLIDDPSSLNVTALKQKSISLHWEFMFTRSMFQTQDIQAQHDLLNEVSKLIEAGKIQSTLGEHFGKINAENLRKAHQLLESSKAKGKIVLEGF